MARFDPHILGLEHPLPGWHSGRQDAHAGEPSGGTVSTPSAGAMPPRCAPDVARHGGADADHNGVGAWLRHPDGGARLTLPRAHTPARLTPRPAPPPPAAPWPGNAASPARQTD